MNKFNLSIICVLLGAATMSVRAQTWNCGAEGSNVSATLSDGTLTVSGQGKMVDYDFPAPRPPWYDFKEQILSVIIENGVTSIGKTAFAYTSLTDLSIGNTVESIGEGAFNSCESLAYVMIPEGVKSIGAKSFACGGLKYLVISGTVTEIFEYAFSPCETSVEEISVSWDNPANVVYDDYIFWNVEKKSVILHVPVGKKAAYEAVDVWKDFDIIADGGTIGDGKLNLLDNLTINTGNLSPEFSTNIHSYKVTVPQSIQSIVITATPVGGATVSGDGQKNLNTGENIFEITAVNPEAKESVYTIIVTRTTTDYFIESGSIAEIETGATTVTVSGFNVDVIDRYEQEYLLTTGRFSGDLLLHFDVENGRYTFDKTVNVDANSIYRFKLVLNIGYNTPTYSFSATTHLDSFGRPSNVTLSYVRRLINLIAFGGNEVVLTEGIRIIGDFIQSGSISDLIFIGNGNFTALNDLLTTPMISIYPNPATDFISFTGLQGNETLHFYTVGGQLLFSRKATSEKEHIAVGFLPSGMYFVKISNGHTLKWIKH